MERGQGGEGRPARRQAPSDLLVRTERAPSQVSPRRGPRQPKARLLDTLACFPPSTLPGREDDGSDLSFLACPMGPSQGGWRRGAWIKTLGRVASWHIVRPSVNCHY